jgi:hypothetical protein
VGTEGQLLRVTAGVPTWGTFAWPITTPGDLIVGDGSGVAVRLARGATGQVLTVQGTGLLAYQAAMPITTRGDLITGDVGGAAMRLARGTTDQLLSVNATGDLLWKTLTTMTNPMTAVGDVIIGGTSGAPSRLAIGATNQVLTVVAGTPAWATAFTNPMTAAQDLIVGGAAGAPVRLAVGSANQVLTVVSGAVAWGPGGLSNPMTNLGDLILGGSAGTPTRLPAVALGQVLISQGVNTAPVWSPDPAIRNLLVQGGTVGTSGVGVLALGPGTAPTTSPVDTVQLWTADFVGVAGSRGLEVRDERGGRYTLATHSDNNTYCRILDPTGALVLDITASGVEGFVGTRSNHIMNFMQNGAIRLAFGTNGYVFITLPGLGQRSIEWGGLDSAGAGYRTLRVGN